MDIIDILLAKKMTSQGQVDTYAAKAQKAAQDATAAAQTVSQAANTITQTESRANEVLAAAEEALSNINLKDIELNKKVTDNNSSVTTDLELTYPDDSVNTIASVSKYYKSSGNNEDGTMTQKAITNYVKQYAGSGGGGGVSNLGSENAGHIVIIGEDGNIIAGNTTEAAIIEALVQSGTYVATGSLGIEIDYENKAFLRTQDATGKEMGENFNSYLMYGGRVRCNVADDGTINAFYGEAGYADDGSNGQVMIYQPKFYYQRVPMKTDENIVGRKIRKETLLISYVKKSGFKLHPLFKNNEEELDYVLLSAYEGTVIGNRLSSVADVKPTSKMTIEAAENYARARGEGWHITNMAAESANQMLEMVEFGSLNGQLALESGVSNFTSTYGVNGSSNTGSTAALGNASGVADATYNNNVSYNEEGKRAISYRGMENPWGNIWRFIGGTYVQGSSSQGGGIPYICTDFNYDYSKVGSNYASTGMNLPSSYGWINAMAYGDGDYDWVFIPAECEEGANSALPVGDSLYTLERLSGTTVLTVGGAWYFQDKNGPFFYACDRYLNQSSQAGYSARLMFIPTKNSTYDANKQKWIQYMGG